MSRPARVKAAYHSGMEALLLPGLVLFVAVSVGILMYRLRGGRLPAPPPWILAVALAIVVTILILAVLMRSWMNVAAFALLTVLYGLMLLQALRARRARGV